MLSFRISSVILCTISRAILGFCLDPHHFRHRSLEHGQERIGFREEL